MVEFPDARRVFLGTAKKFLLDAPPGKRAAPIGDDVPRLTPRNLELTRMSRSRDRILSNLEEMYREAFERAKATEDQGQMAALDFAYRREQLYFEILLDIRDSVEKR